MFLFWYVWSSLVILYSGELLSALPLLAEQSRSLWPVAYLASFFTEIQRRCYVCCPSPSPSFYQQALEKFISESRHENRSRRPFVQSPNLALALVVSNLEWCPSKSHVWIPLQAFHIRWLGVSYSCFPPPSWVTASSWNTQYKLLLMTVWNTWQYKYMASWPVRSAD